MLTTLKRAPLFLDLRNLIQHPNARVMKLGGQGNGNLVLDLFTRYSIYECLAHALLYHIMVLAKDVIIFY